MICPREECSPRDLLAQGMLRMNECLIGSNFRCVKGIGQVLNWAVIIAGHGLMTGYGAMTQLCNYYLYKLLSSNPEGMNKMAGYVH